MRLVDMHCHLDRMANGEEVALAAASRGIGILCTPLTPDETHEARRRFCAQANVRIGAGLHPWWVAEGAPGEQTCSKAAELAAESDYVGEVGLDFSWAHVHTREAQCASFERIAAACAKHPRPQRVLSIHAVRAAREALDILERHALPSRAACVFHWFSGTSGDLARLVHLGCYISVNERMLASRRGREHARHMPLDGLLLETDAPARLDTAHPSPELERSLERTLSLLANIRDVPQDELAVRIAQTSSELLDFT